MYLVDSGLNRNVTTIASVSGGSILNGVVGIKTDFRTVNGREFRKAVHPMLEHITGDCLFFYGSKTNRYLAFTLTAAARSLAAWSVAAGIIVIHAVRSGFQLLGLTPQTSEPMFTLWPIGAALVAVFFGLNVGANAYAGQWNWWVGIPSLLAFAIGVGLIFYDLRATRFAWPMLPALATVSTVALLMTIVTVTAFGRRSHAAEGAMRRVHFGEATIADLGAHGGDQRTQHVICATEIQSGLHAFFSDAFVYSYAYGVSPHVETVPLSLAVQASAALPGGFAPRRINTANLDFEDVGQQPGPGKSAPMILMDGGVYDNMADQWFVGLENRRNRWPAKYEAHLPPVDDLIVVNASTGWIWQPLGSAAQLIRPLREIAAITRDQSVLYNTVGRRRRAHLNDRWKCHAPQERGAFVEVNDNPLDRSSNELKPHVEQIAPRDGWAALVERSRTYPTVLRKIEKQTALEIMWHAYIVTAVSVNRFLHMPVSANDLSTLENFNQQISGIATV